MPSKEELQQIWEEAFDLGYNNASNNGALELWNTTSQKWDNVEIIGSWIEPTWKELDHLRGSIHYMDLISSNHPEYVAWWMGSRHSRIRAKREDGGLDIPATARVLAEIAFSLGGIGSFRVSGRSHIPPPLENYIDLDLQSE